MPKFSGADFPLMPDIKEQPDAFRMATQRNFEQLSDAFANLDTSGTGGGETGPMGPPGPMGPEGPVGPAGPPGNVGTMTTYTHSQGVPAATWTINHNLNRFPSVTITDSTGLMVEGDVYYPSGVQIVLYFSAAFSGTAFLN